MFGFAQMNICRYVFISLVLFTKPSLLTPIQYNQVHFKVPLSPGLVLHPFSSI